MKILLTFLAVAVCTEATINIGPLLGLLEPAARALSVAAPVGPGYASYYRQAQAPAAAPVGPGYASYYRQAPAPAPVDPGQASYYRKAAAPVNSGYTSYYRQAPAPAPAPAPVHPGHASYYRQASAPAPAPAPVHPGHASYYRQAPAPAPAQPAPIVRVIQPIIYVPRPPPATASYYRHPAPPQQSNVVLSPAVHTAAPVVSSTFTVQQPLTITQVQQAAPKTEFSIVPSQSHSFSYANAADFGAQAQSLPQTTINVPFADRQTQVQQAAPKTEFTIVPSQSYSFSYANAAVSGAQAQSLPQTTINVPFAGAQAQSLPQHTINVPFNSFNSASAGASAHSVQSDYSVEMVTSEGHSYTLPDEHITLEKTVAPVTNLEVHDNGGELHNLKLDVRGPNLVEEEPIAVVASAVATATVDEVVNDVAPVVETVAAAEEPVALSGPIVVEPTVETNAQATAEVILDEPVAQIVPIQDELVAPIQEVAPVQTEAAPQPLATVTLDQEDITQQILNQAIPDVIRKVGPQIIQQAIPLIVDRAVPQIVYQVGEQQRVQQRQQQLEQQRQQQLEQQRQQLLEQQRQQLLEQQRKQAENVQIVTPFNRQQQQQQEDEKVFVMYATSVPQEQSQVGFNLRGQYDESENLVVPIGNRNQYNAAAGALGNQANSEPKIVFEKGLDVGSHVEEERRSVSNVNQQIISNFQRENLAYQQERGGAGSANSFSGAGSQQGGFGSANSFSGAGSQQGGFGSASSFSGAGSQQGGFGSANSFSGAGSQQGGFGSANSFSGAGSQQEGFGSANRFSGAGSQQGAFASTSSFSGAGSQQGGFGSASSFSGAESQQQSGLYLNQNQQQ